LLKYSAVEYFKHIEKLTKELKWSILMR
jgi:hypothetical protein